MTPYAAWIQSKTEASNSADSEERTGGPDKVFQDELGGLLEVITENLMASSAAQLRSSLAVMEHRLAEKQRENETSRFLGELSKIEEKTTALVADALVPVLSELQHSRIISEFASILKKALPEFGERRLTINAPDDVHQRLSTALKLQSIDAELASSQDGQIAISGSNVVIRADLDQWARNLSEVAAA